MKVIPTSNIPVTAAGVTPLVFAFDLGWTFHGAAAKKGGDILGALVYAFDNDKDNEAFFGSWATYWTNI